MTCYRRIKGYRSKDLTVNGKRKFVPSSKDSNGSPLQIKCGQCIGCRLDRSLDWAIRITHEASLYEKNCFITLTYSPENLPENGSLVLEHFQLFMKRLRKKYGTNIRFFHCGEYGEQLCRPHYHACLLNFDFPDKHYFNSTPRGDNTYTSSSLSELWPYGHHQIGELSFESAAYCARYVTKKITGKNSDEHYTRTNPYTGELVRLSSEYTTMSRRPGIGAPFLARFRNDVYNFDRVVLRGGASIPPPRFYDRTFFNSDPEAFAKIEKRRFDKNATHEGILEDLRKYKLDGTDERLRVREVVHEATIRSTLKRQYEE